MLRMVVLILVILWAVATVSSYTVGGFIHLLLVLALVLLLVELVRWARSPDRDPWAP